MGIEEVYDVSVASELTVPISLMPLARFAHLMVSRWIRLVSITVFKAVEALNLVIESAGLLQP